MRSVQREWVWEKIIEGEEEEKSGNKNSEDMQKKWKGDDSRWWGKKNRRVAGVTVKIIFSKSADHRQIF